jgi:UDP:flavonoid glycosyltransferase YjiC (YdhE family)
MRIVIIATGTWGDVRPNASLGLALQKKGYTVVLVAAETFRDWVEKKGLPFAGLNVDIQAMLDAQADSSNVLQTIGWMREISQATVQMGKQIADVIEDGDVVLVNEGMLALVNGALEKHRNYCIHINLQPWVPTGSFSGMVPQRPSWLPVSEHAYNRWTAGFVRRSQWWAMGKMGNQVRTEHLGLPGRNWGNHHAMLESTPSLLLVSRHVLPRPVDWAQHHRITGYIFEDDPEWEPPRSLVDFLQSGAKPVYIGFGSLRERKPEALTRLLLDAVERAGVRAVLLSGWAGLGTLRVSNDVHVVEYAPHRWLFPCMAAVVHHGGAGTTAAALRAGVPSIVVPVLSDQPFWGQRLYTLGAATAPIPRAKLTADKLAAAIIEAVTIPTLQIRSAELGAKLSTEDGLSEAVKTIEEFLERRAVSERR